VLSRASLGKLLYIIERILGHVRPKNSYCIVILLGFTFRYVETKKLFSIWSPNLRLFLFSLLQLTFSHEELGLVRTRRQGGLIPSPGVRASY